MKKLLYILLLTPLALVGQDNYSMSFDGVDDWVEINPFNTDSDIDLTIHVCAMGSGTFLSTKTNSYQTYFNYNNTNLKNEIVYHNGQANVNTKHWNVSNYDDLSSGFQFYSLTLNTKNGNTISELFLNGISLGEYIFPNPVLAYTEIEIGRNIVEQNGLFDGVISEIQIWDGVLSQEQIQSLICTSYIGEEETLLGYWNFNEGSGDTVYDLSGNGNHGIIHGATYSEDVPEEGCVIDGCTDSLMYNFNDEANTDDGSCELYSYGCIDSTAYNFDEVANTDDGSCMTYEEFTIDSLQEALSVFETVSEEEDYSMSFDGVDDYVNVPTSNSIDDLSNKLSISAWIYPTNYSSDGSHPRIIHRTEHYGGTSERWFLTWCPNTSGWNAELQFGIGQGGDVGGLTTTSSIPLNEWSYVSVSFNNGSVSLLVNGQTEFQGISPYSSVEHVQGVDLRIASALNNSYFPGKINYLELWNKALTQAEIQNYMNCPPSGEEEGLVGYWNFNEGSGDTLYDLSGNGNHGIIHGATYSDDVPDTQKGCTDIKALNYDETALCDNGSCVYGDDEYSNVVSSLDSTLLTLTDCNTEASTSLSSMQLALDSWNTTIDLDAGWNMFGYGCPAPIDLVQAMSEHTDNIIILKDNNGKAYMPEFGFNGIGDLSPGLGYQIKVTEAIEGFSLCDWYVNDIPEDNIVSLQEELASAKAELDSLYGCVDANACNYDPLAVLDDGECQYPDSGYDCQGICVDELACNYGLNQSQCEFPEPGFNCFGNEVLAQIGDTLYGGIVFYIDSTGQHGLVAALNDLEQDYQWGCYQEYVEGADGTAIGTGLQNTINIVNNNCLLTETSTEIKDGETLYSYTDYEGLNAARAAYEYESGGFDDWYLPSIDELYEMYNSIGNGGPEGNIGGPTSSVYWSSSDSNNYSAWLVHFSNGRTSYLNKYYTFRVRVIRAF